MIEASELPVIRIANTMKASTLDCCDETCYSLLADDLPHEACGTVIRYEGMDKLNRSDLPLKSCPITPRY